MRASSACCRSTHRLFCHSASDCAARRGEDWTDARWTRTTGRGEKETRQSWAQPQPERCPALQGGAPPSGSSRTTASEEVRGELKQALTHMRR